MYVIYDVSVYFFLAHPVCHVMLCLEIVYSNQMCLINNMTTILICE